MVAAVRQLAGGRLLVNDINNRQLTILDPGLANAFLLADSTSGRANSYGTRAGGLISYVGDSTLFVDPAGLSMFVIDPGGKIARVASVPRSQDAPSLGNNLLGHAGRRRRGASGLSQWGLRITQQGGKGAGRNGRTRLSRFYGDRPRRSCHAQGRHGGLFQDSEDENEHRAVRQGHHDDERTESDADRRRLGRVVERIDRDRARPGLPRRHPPRRRNDCRRRRRFRSTGSG